MMTARFAALPSLAALPVPQHGTALALRGDWAAVEVRLGNDRHPYRFIVDSAAGATVIDQALAPIFTKAGSGSSDVQGASGDQASFQNAKLRRLSVADFEPFT